VPISISSIAQLQTNHIDLWVIEPARLSSQSLSFLQSLLSTSEQQALKKYKHPKAHHTALITRSVSRLILSEYIALAPNEIVFIRNQHGKPEIKNNPHHIRFNLSHNNELIVMAVCVKDDIGCDIENPQRSINIEPITRRYFSSQEHIEITNCPITEQQIRFFEIWTLKEALVKATGVGISLGLDSFYFKIDKNNTTSPIKLFFNAHYPLNKNLPWQLYQQSLMQQLVAICRVSHLKQSINLLTANELIEKH